MNCFAGFNKSYHLRCPATALLLPKQPDWFRELGTPIGIQELELLLDVSVPESLSIFYRYPAFGCWLMAHHATEIFFDDRTSEQFPCMARWHDRPHLIIAELPHSGLKSAAVELDQSIHGMG